MAELFVRERTNTRSEGQPLPRRICSRTRKHLANMCNRKTPTSRIRSNGCSCSGGRGNAGAPNGAMGILARGGGGATPRSWTSAKRLSKTRRHLSTFQDEKTLVPNNFSYYTERYSVPDLLLGWSGASREKVWDTVSSHLAPRSHQKKAWDCNPTSHLARGQESYLQSRTGSLPRIPP